MRFATQDKVAFSLSGGSWTLYQLFTELLRRVEYALSQPVAYHVKALQVKNPDDDTT
jgi:hypothetical protein